MIRIVLLSVAAASILLAPTGALAWGVPPARPAPAGAASAERSPLAWARATCDGIMRRSPVLTERWHYDVGLVLSGFEAVWRRTGDRRYFDYIKANVDRLVGADGTIKGYEPRDYMLDDVNMGKLLFALHADARDAAERERYRKALYALRAQLAAQPRTADGGFWHKQIYPHQMWADGVYMAAPFLARFAAVFGEPAALDDAVKQVLLAETHLRDAKTGLLYHGWDESRTQRWADRATGRSSQFWGRGDGWYAMAVADVLAEMPPEHPQRGAVLAVLQRLARAIVNVQDGATGVWWQVLDAAGKPGNFREASASAMFVYALMKAMNHGWLDRQQFARAINNGYAGLMKQFFVTDAPDGVHVSRICKVAGLGGDPYRDGSYGYYVGTEVVTDDPKGVGAFILAGAEVGS
ncbi:MAG TPA: glycoside hydrolase family 88 protein [Polyangia bacterium]